MCNIHGLATPSSRNALQVHPLSAYEFARHYRFKLVAHPQTEQQHRNHINKPELYHAKLTEHGVKKVAAAGRRPALIAGEDYQIREVVGAEWHCLGQGEHVDPAYRHDWVIVPRKRPNVPVPYGAQGSKSEEEQAMKLLLLFFPWVNDVRDATAAVPFIGHFWVEGGKSWREAFPHRRSQTLRPELLHRAFFGPRPAAPGRPVSQQRR